MGVMFTIHNLLQHQFTAITTLRLFTIIEKEDQQIAKTQCSIDTHHRSSLPTLNSPNQRTADLSTHVSEPCKKNMFLQSLYKEEQEKSYMTNGNNNGKHAFHSDIQDKDIVEALENEVKYWTDFSKVHYHPQSLYEYNGFCMILYFV
ncbi:uncharacterized protein LOC114306640 isoform X1 [Camellia sinensis]|uniref:Uncharacterized protein n=1 Tax=Camellia sinensis var. sinensis TaxID=542762 RepID=A0A4S4DW68_CAMSN|nr:uncharacterized protein LOC114306640 isoform X1 [Camellia sinensis]THG06856.1 hypothetical protein TEA_010193 [Camellia sinensis var. sinensis]